MSEGVRGWTGLVTPNVGGGEVKRSGRRSSKEGGVEGHLREARVREGRNSCLRKEINIVEREGQAALGRREPVCWGSSKRIFIMLWILDSSLIVC